MNNEHYTNIIKTHSQSIDLDQIDEELVDRNTLKDIRQSNKPKQKFSLINILCCVYEDEIITTEIEKSQNNFTPVQIQKNLIKRKMEEIEPKAQLAILGNQQTRNYCLVSLTQKNFFVDLLLLKQFPRKKQNNIQKDGSMDNNDTGESARSYSSHSYGLMRGPIVFSQFYKGIKADTHQIQQSLPEKVVIYLAQRCQPYNLIVDAFARCGNTSIIFGLIDETHIFSLEENQKNINQILINSLIYNVQNKLNIIQANFLTFNLRKLLKPDLIFIQPEFIQPDETNPFFSLSTHIKPDIHKLIPKALAMCQNCIFVFPKYSQVEEISEYFSYYLGKIQDGDIKIEIQIIQIDGYVAYYIIYTGSVANVQNQDQVVFLCKLILNDNNQCEELSKATVKLIQKISQDLTTKELFDLILSIQESSTMQSETLLSLLIQHCVAQGLLDKDDIKQIFIHFDVSTLNTTYTPRYKPLSGSPATFDPKASETAQKQDQFEQKFEGKQILEQKGNQLRKNYNISFQQTLHQSKNSFDFIDRNEQEFPIVKEEFNKGIKFHQGSFHQC